MVEQNQPKHAKISRKENFLIFLGGIYDTNGAFIFKKEKPSVKKTTTETQEHRFRKAKKMLEEVKDHTITNTNTEEIVFSKKTPKI